MAQEPLITWQGVLAVENVRTGDSPKRRMLASDSLSWPDLPIPFRWQRTDLGGHTGSVVVGTITHITRDDNQILALGTYDHNSLDGLEAARLAHEKIVTGLSIDPDEAIVTTVPIDASGNILELAELEAMSEEEFEARGIMPMDLYKSARIRSTTQVAIPALIEGRITAVHGYEEFARRSSGIDEPVTPAETRGVDRTADDLDKIRRPSYAVTASGHPIVDFPTTPDSVPDNLTAAAASHSGAMVALIPSPDDAARLAVPDYESPEVLHLTLAFLGDASDWDSTEREDLTNAIQQIAADLPPVTANIWAVGNFNPDKEQASTYLVGGSDLAALDGLAPDLASTFRDIPDQHTPWVPHITIGYSLDPTTLNQFGPVTFTHIRVAFGDDTTIDFPLGDTGNLPSANAALPTPADSQPQLTAAGGFASPSPSSLSLLIPMLSPHTHSFAVASPHSTPTVNEPFDGNAIERSLPTGEQPTFYARFYAWLNDDTEGTAKDNWRYLHHHFQEGANAGAANIRACRAGIGVLNGARGVQVNLSPDEKMAVWQHLALHMEDAGVTPPQPKWSSGFVSTSDPFSSQLDDDCGCDDDGLCVCALTASAATITIPTVPTEHFAQLRFNTYTPLTITDSGHIYGHIARNDVCHVGMPGCVTMPISNSELAYFNRAGGVVRLDDGTDLPVGHLTMRGSHADVRLGWKSAMAHYDDISTVAADLIAWEDAFGVAVTGHVRNTLTPDDVHALRASKPSGDWRNIGGTAELINIHATNSPGFPIYYAKDGMHQTTIVASADPIRHGSDDDLHLDELADDLYATYLRQSVSRFYDLTADAITASINPAILYPAPIIRVPQHTSTPAHTRG